MISRGKFTSLMSKPKGTKKMATKKKTPPKKPAPVPTDADTTKPLPFKKGGKVMKMKKGGKVKKGSC